MQAAMPAAPYIPVSFSMCMKEGAGQERRGLPHTQGPGVPKRKFAHGAIVPKALPGTKHVKELLSGCSNFQPAPMALSCLTLATNKGWSAAAFELHP